MEEVYTNIGSNNILNKYAIGYIIVLIVITIEILFYIIIKLIIAPLLESPTEPHPFPYDQKLFILRIFEAVHNLDCYSFEKFFSRFFLDTEFKNIYKDNVYSFLAWYMLNKSFDKLTKQDKWLITDVFEEACKLYPELRNIKDGYNPKIRHVQMCLEPIPFLHRPLIVYLVLRAFEFIVNTVILRGIGGFRCYTVNGIRYWYRKHAADSSIDNNSGRDPYLFLHGISPGWSCYLFAIKAFSENRDMILLDLDAVRCISLCFSMPTPQQFADTVKDILCSHNIERVSVIGHSFGSISSNWLISRHPHLVSHLTMIDPVSLLLGFPDVAYSFVYRPPRNIVQWIIYIMASKELTISHMLYRQFWWYQNNMWLEDIPDHIGVVIGLATDDQITEPYVLEEYVQRCQEKRILKAAGATLVRTTNIKSKQPITFPSGLSVISDGSHGNISSASAYNDWNENSREFVLNPAQMTQYLLNKIRSTTDQTFTEELSSKSRSRQSSSSAAVSDCFSSIKSAAEMKSSKTCYLSLSRTAKSFESLSCLDTSTSINDGGDSRGTTAKSVVIVELPKKTSTSIPGVWEHCSTSINSAIRAAGYHTASIITIQNDLGKLSDCGDQRYSDKDLRASEKVALIECIVWDKFVHGQILMPGKVQRHFVSTVLRNEISAAINK